MKSMPSVPGPTWCQDTKKRRIEASVMVRERGPRVKRPAHSTARERWLPGFSASFAPRPRRHRRGHSPTRHVISLPSPGRTAEAAAAGD